MHINASASHAFDSTYNKCVLLKNSVARAALTEVTVAGTAPFCAAYGMPGQLK